MHGPISPQFKVFVNQYESKSPILSDLARVETRSSEREFVRNSKYDDVAFSLPTQWEIAGQNGVKITVKRDGWYLVSAQELVSPDSTSIRTVRTGSSSSMRRKFR